MFMKHLAKSAVAAVLGWQVRRLYKKNDFKVVAVAGSVGKTTTKLAIAKVLSRKYRVQYQEGNYNELVSVPLIFFGRSLPSLFNPFSWLLIFVQNELALLKKYPYDVVVVEIGTDGPGQLDSLGKYLKVELGVLSAITPEHMQFFDDLDAVAHEELAITRLSSLTLINKDMVAQKYLPDSNILTYAIKSTADYQLAGIKITSGKSQFSFVAGSKIIFEANHEITSEPLLYSILAACAVGQKLGMEAAELKQAIGSVKPFAGRMQILSGIKNSKILDDSYNASPAAVEAALNTLYANPAPQKIALLGNMNELGKYTAEAHTAIGQMCDPKKLDLVVTLGPDANKYLAPAAAARGCRVEKFDDPYKAGDFIAGQIKDGALILVKG